MAATTTVSSPSPLAHAPCVVAATTCEDGCRNLDHLVRDRLDELNAVLAKTDPRVILQWLKGLRIDGGATVQFTSFGLTGVVITHLLEQVGLHCPVVFIDTLHHFQETLDLKDHYVKAQPNRSFYSYGPEGVANRAEFEQVHGSDLWQTDPSAYDYLAKIEPTFRALHDLDVKVWITGRRRSQGDERTKLEVIEVARDGRIKINPLCHWSWAQTLAYAQDNGIKYNPLIDRGYKSVGDVMTTVPVDPNSPERAGRWTGQGKTECGMHNRLSEAEQRAAKAKKDDDGVAAA